MLPNSLLRSTATITRTEQTGNGTKHAIVHVEAPCIVVGATKTAILTDGPTTYKTQTFHFQPTVDVQLHDVIHYQGDPYQVYEIRPRIAPNLKVDHLEVVAW